MSQAPKERRDWTNEELDLIVADYFSMLRDETAGLAFNKAAHNRILQDHIDRSKASIEFKHRNISAVLELLGVQPINGYLPAANFQRALIGAVERFVQTNPSVLHPEKLAEAALGERPQLFVQAAPTLLPATALSGPIERLVRKFDPAERDFRNRQLGRSGEELVLHQERANLIKLERPDLARKIRWVSEEDGDGAGYDILSFDRAGKERLLEVKTTVGPNTTPFYITRNELSFSDERPDAFRLCRVFDFAKQPQMFELNPPLKDHVRLTALNFKASFS
jgi:Domain of unknown function (DUF3883)